MRSRVTVLGILLAGTAIGLSLLVSCGEKSGGVVARVGGRTITVAEYNDDYMAISAPVRPRQMDTMEGKRRFLEDLINKEILVSEAKKRGYADTPDMQQAMKFVTDQEVLAALRTEAVDDRIKLEPGAVRDLYEKRAIEYHVRALILRDREGAEAARDRLEKGATFKDLARESMLARMYPDADLGWRGWGEFDEPVNSALLTLDPGVISPVLEPAGGDFVIGTVVETRPNEEWGTFEQMRGSLVSDLQNMRRRELTTQWTVSAMKEHQVRVNDDVIREILPRLEWPVGPTGEEQRPDFTPEEEALVIGTYAGGQMTVGSMIDDLMLFPRTSRPDHRADPRDFARLIRMQLTNQALLDSGYERGIHKRPEIQRKLERSREERMVTTLYNTIIQDVVVTEPDVEQYYEDYKESLRQAEQYHLSRIVLPTEEKARDVLRKIRRGEDFAKMAMEHSVDRSTAQKGGRLTPATVDVLPPAVREVVVTLSKGEVGGPAKTEDGWMLIRLDDHTPERQLSLDETRDRIRTELLRTRQGDAFDAWLEEQRNTLGVEVYEDVLAEVELVPDETPDETPAEES